MKATELARLRKLLGMVVLVAMGRGRGCATRERIEGRRKLILGIVVVSGSPLLLCKSVLGIEHHLLIRPLS